MNVTMDKVKLLNVLKENKTIHLEEYNEAKENYVKVVEEAFTKCVEDFKNTKTLNLQPLIALRKPENHADEYDRAIKMLEMSSVNSIELSEHEFTELVMDEWSWKRNFEFTNMSYGVTSKAVR